MRDDILAAREKHRDLLQAAGKPPYPTWHGRTHQVSQVLRTFETLADQATTITVTGRLTASREHGAVRFLDLKDVSGQIQLFVRAEAIPEREYRLLDALDQGDVLAATGRAVKTSAGERSIAVERWTLLAKALSPPPEKRAGLKDEEERARRREVDLLANEVTRRTFDLRTAVFRALRNFLEQEGFSEVETPVLQRLAGGAAARPFRTYHNALNLALSLRIAPELQLKRLIAGGYEKIYELGKVFRNEGTDRQHNPEFTICELYQAYATVEDLIPLTERLVASLVETIHGGETLTYQGKHISLVPPWPRVTFVEAVRKSTGVDVLAERDQSAYREALGRLGAPLPTDQSLPNLQDELLNRAVRKKTTGPLLIMGAPVELEPLAKRDEEDPRLVQRLQLIVAGMELVKAYTEENDPVEQEARFRSQARLRQGFGGASPQNNVEIHPLDDEYLESLRIGLPPTAGWGLGVDRLVMLLSDQPSIRDVLFFPLLRPRHPSEPAGGMVATAGGR